jgi:hypothetical protein
VEYDKCEDCKLSLMLFRYKGSLFFQPSCVCAHAPTVKVDWDEMADYINNTDKEERYRLRGEFGLSPESRI